MSDQSRRALLEAGAAALSLTALSGCLPLGERRDRADPRRLLETGDGDTASWADTAVEGPDECDPTAAVDEGPYYLDGAPARADLRTAGEAGTVFHLTLLVRSGIDCGLLADATIDFWHVMQTGLYDLETEEMHYRCKLMTGFDGRVGITTLKPISYLTDTGKLMPSHFHATITAFGHDPVTTQLRFKDDPDDDGMVPDSLLLSTTTGSDGSESSEHTFTLSPA